MLLHVFLQVCVKRLWHISTLSDALVVNLADCLHVIIITSKCTQLGFLTKSWSLQ